MVLCSATVFFKRLLARCAAVQHGIVSFPLFFWTMSCWTLNDVGALNWLVWTLNSPVEHWTELCVCQKSGSFEQLKMTGKIPESLNFFGRRFRRCHFLVSLHLFGLSRGLTLNWTLNWRDWTLNDVGVHFEHQQLWVQKRRFIVPLQFFFGFHLPPSLPA